MTVHIWKQTEKKLLLFLRRPSSFLTRGKKTIHGKLVQREKGKRVMELIYNQNDNQLQSRQRETEGEKCWKTARKGRTGRWGWDWRGTVGYWEAVAPLSIWVKFIKQRVCCRGTSLRTRPRPKVETAEAVIPRSWLVPGVNNFKKKKKKKGGLKMIMMKTDENNDDRWCTDTLVRLFPSVTENRRAYIESMASNKNGNQVLTYREMFHISLPTHTIIYQSTQVWH